MGKCLSVPVEAPSRTRGGKRLTSSSGKGGRKSQRRAEAPTPLKISSRTPDVHGHHDYDDNGDRTLVTSSSSPTACSETTGFHTADSPGPGWGNHGNDTRNGKASPDIAVTRYVASVIRTMPYEVAAKTNGRWGADAVARGHDTIDIRLYHKDDNDVNALVRAKFPKSFPDEAPHLTYLGPRFDSPLDVKLALGLNAHPLSRGWQRNCRIVDIMGPVIMDVMDAHLPLPPISSARLKFQGLEKNVVEMIEYERKVTDGRACARGLFLRMGTLLREIEETNAAVQRPLTDFALMEWLENLVGEIGGMLVPVKDKKYAIGAMCRLIDVLASLQPKRRGDEGVQHLKYQIQDVTAKWANKQKAMSLRGLFRGLVDMWAWIMEEKGRLAGARVGKTKAMKNHDEENEAVARFVAGAHELGVIVGPFWSPLALAFHMLWQDLAVIGARVVPMQYLEAVLSHGFDAMPVDLHQDDNYPEYEHFVHPVSALASVTHTHARIASQKGVVVLALCLRDVSRLRPPPRRSRLPNGGWLVKTPPTGSRVTYALPLGVMRR